LLCQYCTSYDKDLKWCLERDERAHGSCDRREAEYKDYGGQEPRQWCSGQDGNRWHTPRYSVGDRGGRTSG